MKTLAAVAPLLLVALLAACGSAPPAPPKQVQEYQRHTSVGLEKHGYGLPLEARSAFRRALTHAELDDSHERIASALLNIGASELLLDEPETAGQAYARAAREARLGQLPTLEWQAQSGLAEATRRLGQPAKALELYASLPPTGQPTAAIRRAMEIARALALADGGSVDDALAALAQVEPAVRAIAADAGAGNTLLGSLLLARARVLLRKNDLAAAQTAATEALAADRALHHPPSVADDHRWLGEILLARQERAAAFEHLQRAARIYAQTGQRKRLTEIERLVDGRTAM